MEDFKKYYNDTDDMEIRTIRNSKVLVTGGAGFIGSNLCERLLAQDNYVVCLDNFSTGHRHNISDFINHKRFRLIYGDIRNYKDCRKAVLGMEHVLHHAALGSVPRSMKDPILTNEVNVGGFVKMMFAAKEEGIKRFVYASSSSVYGDSPELPKVEHEIGKPLSPYAITKLMNEVYARNFSELYGLETIGLRYFNVFGRRQDPHGAYAAVIPKFILQLIKHERPVINGDGSFSRDFTYVDNVIQATQLAAVTPMELIRKRQIKYYKSPNNLLLAEVLNIACGNNVSLNELLHELRIQCQVFDSEIAHVVPLYGPRREGDIPHSQANIEKAMKLINYCPKVPPRDGFSRVCKWYWEKVDHYNNC